MAFGQQICDENKEIAQQEKSNDFKIDEKELLLMIEVFFLFKDQIKKEISVEKIEVINK